MKDQIIEFLRQEAAEMRAQAKAKGMDPEDRAETLANATGIQMAMEAVRDRFHA